MITEQAVALRQELERQEELRARVNEVKSYREVRDHLRTLAKTIRPILDRASAFEERAKVDLGPAKGQARALAEKISALSHAYAEQPARLLRADTFAPKTLAGAANAIGRVVDERCGLAWQTYHSKAAARVTIDQAILDVLATISGFAATVKRVRDLSRSVADWSVRVPADRAQFDQFDALVKSLAEEWATLPATDVPPAVVSFLRDAGGRGARLDQLDDPTVRTWLKTHGLVEKFRVTVIR